MKTKEPGFILFETMIALVILGVVIVTCMQSITAFTRSNSSSYNMSLAGLFGQQLLAGIYKNDFNLGTSRGDFGSDYPQFRWELAKSKLSTTQAQYVCSVFWTERGIEQNAVFNTSKFESDMK